MARNTTLSIPQEDFTELSDAENITGSVKVQNVGSYDLWIMATSDATAPTTIAGGTMLRPGQGERGTLADLFPGVSSPVRLWAWSALPGAASVQYAS